MNTNRRSWFNSWFKPSNLIALAALFVTAFGVFAGMTFFPKSQKITGKEGCDIDNISQTTNEEVYSSQEVDCEKSTIKNIKQDQSK